MKLMFLGSGAWEGIPAPFCGCRVCGIARENPYSRDSRTRTSIRVTVGRESFLIELSPDIRLQSVMHGLRPVSDFVVSHWHFDHLYGLLELQARAEFAKKPVLYCSQKTADWIEGNFSHIKKRIVVLKPFQAFKLKGLKITPFPVYHMFQEDEGLSASELENTFGFLLENGSKKIAYLADYFKIPEESADLVRGSDILIADGTYLFEEHFPKKPQQNAGKQDKNHLHGKKILDTVNALDPKQAIFHSISHLTEKTNKELQKMLPKGMTCAYDGMEISRGGSG